jgi:hypothetical protein
MNQTDFDYWVAVLRQHFPDHKNLSKLEQTWFPNGGKGWLKGHAERLWRGLLRKTRMRLP